MKIKFGFIANSSSSSFVVAFPKNAIKNIKDVCTLLFDDERYVTLDWTDVLFLTEEVSKTIFEKIKKQQEPSNLQAIFDAINGAWFSGTSDIIDGAVKNKYSWDECYKILYFKALDLMVEFVKNNYNKDIYVFEFSDHTEYGGVLEHGDIFRRLPHLELSRH